MFISLEISFKILYKFFIVYDQEKKNKKEGVKYLTCRSWKESSRYVT